MRTLFVILFCAALPIAAHSLPFNNFSQEMMHDDDERERIHSERKRDIRKHERRETDLLHRFLILGHTNHFQSLPITLKC